MKLKLTEKSRKWVIRGIVIALVGYCAICIVVKAFTTKEQTAQTVQTASYETYYRELELQYWGVKYAIVEEVEAYMDKVAPTHNLSALELLNGCDKYDIDIRLAMVQGQVESHFGTKGLASKTNQVWNVGAFDGLSADEIPSRHKFKHPNESIEPYLRLISHRYLGDFKTEQQLLRKFVDTLGMRYASNTLYEQELSAQWDKINSTTGLDTLIAKYNYLKTELKR